MDEFVAKFTTLMHYVSYIKEHKAKGKRFLNCLSIYFKERIELDNSKIVD